MTGSQSVLRRPGPFMEWSIYGKRKGQRETETKRVRDREGNIPVAATGPVQTSTGAPPCSENSLLPCAQLSL